MLAAKEPAMLTRILALSAACWLGLSLSAAAIPFMPPPQPVYEAPIDRALMNVAQMEGVEPAQRERLMGRLNLLAFARDDAPFAYMADSNDLNEAGALRCVDAPPSQGRGASPEPPPVFAPADLCARHDFYLGPMIELPATPVAAPSPAALARLRAARDHYQRALQLERNNLRALLGLAYAQDRLGSPRAARRTLRTLIDAGLPKLSGPQSDWEDHAVLTEAAEHLSHLAKSVGDHAKIAALRERLGASRPMIYVTPIVVPLADAPFAQLVDAASPVAFDFSGTGDKRAQGWLRPDAAWLVWDPQARGQVRSGFDLIGAVAWAVFWSDGFEALRALDDDRSGDLTGAELGGLALWRDANANGASDAGEVAPVAAHAIVALAVRGDEQQRGLLTAQNGVRFENGAVRPLYDWTPGLAPSSPRVAENRAAQLALRRVAP
jgi:hypothetical protein